MATSLLGTVCFTILNRFDLPFLKKNNKIFISIFNFQFCKFLLQKTQKKIYLIQKKFIYTKKIFTAIAQGRKKSKKFSIPIRSKFRKDWKNFPPIFEFRPKNFQFQFGKKIFHFFDRQKFQFAPEFFESTIKFWIFVVGLFLNQSEVQIDCEFSEFHRVSKANFSDLEPKKQEFIQKMNLKQQLANTWLKNSDLEPKKCGFIQNMNKLDPKQQSQLILS